jgi:hypothetical protein
MHPSAIRVSLSTLASWSRNLPTVIMYVDYCFWSSRDQFLKF